MLVSNPVCCSVSFTNWLKLNQKYHCSKVLLNSLQINGQSESLSIESKVRKLCITQGVTMGVKGEVCPNRNWASQGSSVPALISGFCSMQRLGVFLTPLDGILVHRRLPPSILSACPQTIYWFLFIHVGGERHCES